MLQAGRRLLMEAFMTDGNILAQYNEFSIITKRKLTDFNSKIWSRKAAATAGVDSGNTTTHPRDVVGPKSIRGSGYGSSAALSSSRREQPQQWFKRAEKRRKGANVVLRFSFRCPMVFGTALQIDDEMVFCSCQVVILSIPCQV